MNEFTVTQSELVTAERGFGDSAFHVMLQLLKEKGAPLFLDQNNLDCFRVDRNWSLLTVRRFSNGSFVFTFVARG